MKVPMTKNGPKGTSDFKVFLPKIISAIPIIAPIKKAENKATMILGQPRTSPIKKASLISPTPIQRPLDINTISKKNNDARKAEVREFNKNGKFPISNFQFLNKSK